MAARPKVTADDCAGQHVFDHGWRWWDAYFATVLVATLVTVALGPDPAVGRVAACACLAATVPAYLAVGRRAIVGDDRGRFGTIYLIMLVALVVAAQSQASESTWVLFAASPQCFMVASLRRAVAGVAVLNLTPVAFLLEPDRRGPTALVIVPTTAVFGLAFSVAFGIWITRIIAQSVERAELIQRLQAAQAELAVVSRQAGTLAERERLAREIHDTLAQGLTSIVMLLQAADAEIGSNTADARRHLALAIQTAREGLAEARAMVAALTPAHLAAAPLHEALRRLTDGIGAELGIAASCEVEGPVRPLPVTTEVALLRAAQEALANVRKHAAAGSVRVVLSYREQAVQLDITDDGAGFDPDRVIGGYGLRGMRDRISQAGGSFAVLARPGAGTALSVEVPG